MKRIATIILTLFLTGAVSLQAMTLSEAVAIGKQRSLKIQGPRIDADKVEGQITEAWSNALPQVSALASYQRAFKAPVYMQKDNSVYAQATLDQPIYTFGRIGAGLQAAFAARQANSYTASAAEKSLELDVMRGFWSVLLVRDVLQVRRDGLGLAQKSLDRVIELRKVGMVSDFDVLRARSQTSSLVPAVTQAESDLSMATLAFKELLGIPLDTTITIDGTLEVEPAGKPGEKLGAVMDRDDLNAIRSGVKSLENIYTIYHNADMPAISAQFKYSWQWSADNWTGTSNNQYSVFTGGLGILLPIWSSGKTSGQAQQIKADWRKAQLGLQMAERGVQLQVAMANDAYSTASKSIEAAKIAVEQAVQARQASETRLNNGQITQLELQAAQLDETAARLGLANARFQYLVADANLRLAVGQSPFAK